MTAGAELPTKRDGHIDRAHAPGTACGRDRDRGHIDRAHAPGTACGRDREASLPLSHPEGQHLEIVLQRPSKRKGSVPDAIGNSLTVGAA